MVTNFDGKKTIRKGIKKFNTFDVRFHIGFEIELPLEAKKITQVWMSLIGFELGYKWVVWTFYPTVKMHLHILHVISIFR